MQVEKPQLVSFPDDAPLDDILAVFRRDGAVIINNMLNPSILESLNNELKIATESFKAGSRSNLSGVKDFWGERTIRYSQLAKRSPTFLNNVLVHDLYHKIVSSELDDPYWMNTGQMMVVCPFEKCQLLHRDAENWPNMCLSSDQPEVTVSCMFALNDFTEENGATVVVPGSHKWEDYNRQAQPAEITQAVMPAGSGMIYSGKVIHGAGQNRSNTHRHGMHLSFVRGWLTPEEAGSLNFSLDEAKTLTPLQQRFLGFRCYDISKQTASAVRLWCLDYEDIPVALGW